jgi:hypothetical protein
MTAIVLCAGGFQLELLLAYMVTCHLSVISPSAYFCSLHMDNGPTADLLLPKHGDIGVTFLAFLSGLSIDRPSIVGSLLIQGDCSC